MTTRQKRGHSQRQLPGWLRTPLITMTILAGLLGSCKASVKGDIHTGVEEGPPEAPPEAPPAAPLVAPSSPPAPAASAAETSFIGVTHALTLSPKAAAKERCSCLAAAVGAPSDPAFVWQGKAPVVGSEAVALAIDAAPCKQSKSGRGPSIQGIEKDGDAVVVSLEEPRSGVPIARGAIVLRPPQGVLVLRAPDKLPYGKALSGKNGEPCLVRLDAP